MKHYDTVMTTACVGFQFINKLITIQKAAKREICIKKPPAVVTTRVGQ